MTPRRNAMMESERPLMHKAHCNQPVRWTAFLSGISMALTLLLAPDTVSAQTVLTGSAQSRFFGWSLASADFNGDGVPDIVVGSPRDAVGSTRPGAAYVFDGRTFMQMAAITVPPVERCAQGMGDCQFGSSVAAADVTGDGIPDIVVGAPYVDAPGNIWNQGRVYVYSGPAFTLVNVFDTPNLSAGAVFGTSVALGDVDHDGRHDIIVGAPGENTVYAFSGVSSTLIRTITSPVAEPGGNFGAALAAGDVDSDGFADILIGAPNEDVNRGVDFGRACLASGATSNFLRVVVATTMRATAPTCGAGLPGCWFGSSVALADVDGDRTLDAIVGAYLEDDIVPDQGAVYVFTDILTLPRNLRLTTPSPNQFDTLGAPCATQCNRFGVSVAGADVYHNGRAEIIVGANAEAVPCPGTLFTCDINQGRVYVFNHRGRLLTTIDSPGSPDPPSALDPEALFGISVATADLNGDRRADIIAGATRDEDASSTGVGRVYIFPSQHPFPIHPFPSP